MSIPRLLFVFFFSVSFAIQAQTVPVFRLDSALRAVDKAITEKPRFELQKRQQIQNYKLALQRSHSIEDKLQNERLLVKEYSNFRLDSALFFARLISSQIDSTDLQQHILCDMQTAEALKGMGYYESARQLLDAHRKEVDAEHLVSFYHVYYSIYHSLYQNAFLESDRVRFADSLIHYRQCLQSALRPGEIGHDVGQAHLSLFMGRADEAMHIIDRRIKQDHADLREDNLLAFTMALICDSLGARRDAEYYYSLSAIDDLQRASKKYTSLQRLAVLLYQDGDVDRAYRYLTCALEDVTFCRIHCRITQISQFLPIISSAYNEKAHAASVRKIAFSIALALLLLLASVGMWFLFRRNTALARLSSRFKSLNNQLQDTNDRLATTNLQLADANRIKEEYIGQVFNLCSAYMDRQESFRRSIYNKIKSNQLNEVKALVSDKSQSQEDLHDFFRNFDAIFLSLFPDFITEFNALLRPEEAVTVRDGELLSPELRIYALVRLGINDSTRIASFLHFSPQTVYNYRLKMRSRTELSRDTFVQAVQNLK